MSRALPDWFSLEGRVAVVTGASSGLGAAVAETLGLRSAMWLGAAGGFLALVILASSRVRALRTMPGGPPAPASAVTPGEDVPLAE